MKLARKADRIAAQLQVPSPWRYSPDVIRDVCDAATGGDLSCSLLDRLCDMVHRRLERMDQSLIQAERSLKPLR